MDNQSVKSRLLIFIKSLGIGQKKFETTCGLANGYVNNIRKSISPEKLQKIVRCYPELNAGWLMSGEGEMLKVGTRQETVDSIVNSTNANYDKSGIPTKDFFAYVQENQRQIGELIDTIAALSRKIQ